MGTFYYAGIYEYDSLDVACVPMDSYPEKIKALNKSVLQDVKLETDTITGYIQLNDPQILCLTVPYRKGWTLTIDGEEVPVVVVNERYLGAELTGGNHEIVYQYRMPLLREGAILSVIGFSIFLIWLIRRKLLHL